MGQNPLEYGRCSLCGYKMFPILPVSPCGHDAPVEQYALDSTGQVYSWTNLRLGSTPGLLVMVDFFDGELRVTAPLIGVDRVDIGDSVRLAPASDTPYAFVAVG